MRKERVKLRTLGKKLKILRCRNDLTQEEFSAELDVSLDSVRNWEQGYNYPSIDMLIKIADFFQCDFDYLLGEQESPNKTFKHFSEETGLSEKAVRNILFFSCDDTDIINTVSEFLEDLQLLMFLDDCVKNDYSKLALVAANGNDKIHIDSSVLLRLDKLDLYNWICSFIDSLREKNNLNIIHDEEN